MLERLTSEAVACHLQAFPPTEPLFYMPSAAEAINGGRSVIQFLPNRKDVSSEGPGSRLRIKFLNPEMMQTASSCKGDVDKAKELVLNSLLALYNEGDGSEPLSSNEFITLCEGSHEGISPLFVETALQLGLMSDPHIPSLVHSLLTEAAPAQCRRFLRRWLLTPPSPNGADALAKIVEFMKEEGMSLPALVVPPIGKVLSVIRAHQVC